MVSDSELINRLRVIVRSSDLDTATAGSVRRQLEEEFGVDLRDRKIFIREQIDGFLETRFVEPQNDDAHEEQEEEEEEEEGAEEGCNDEEMEEEIQNVKQEENEISGSHTGEAVRSKKKRSHDTDKNEKRKGSGFTKPCAISPQLQEIVGVPEMARTEVVKKIWAYIREKNLQNPKDKRKIICDEKLRGIFRVNSINMFQMTKALSKHIWPIGAEDELHNDDAQQHEEDQEEEEAAAEEDSNFEEIEEESENVKQDKNVGNGSHEVDTEEEEEEEEDEDDDGEEEQSNGERSKKRRSHDMDKNEKKKGSGFTKPCAISPQLQEIVGAPEMARTEVVKKIWAYIREKSLQNPKDKRKIICDEKLRGIFRVNSINMFQMTKSLSKHIWPIDAEYEIPVESSQKETQQKKSRQQVVDKPNRKEKQQKGRTSGLLAPLPLSDALAKFFGTGENALSRADAVKRMWKYIKENELQDPTDRRRIICDDKLNELFNVRSFIGFTVSKLLNAHFHQNR